MEYQKIYLIVSFLAGVVTTVAWWVAAVKKPGVALFFWLASAQTVSLGLGSVVTFTGLASRWPGYLLVLVVLAVVHAVLYVQLVRWVLARP